MEFWTLYDRHCTKIYNYLTWFLGNRNDAEDLTSVVFLKAYEQFKTLRSPDKAEAWLWTIARNAAMNFRRDRKQALQIEHIPIDPSSPSEHCDQTRHLWLALSKLSPQDRDILILREYHGFSYSELAEILENTVSGIKSRLFRARENLREQYFSLEV